MGSAWDLAVIAYLLDGPKRFNEILRVGKTENLNSRTLSRVLKQLTDNEFVKRKVLDTQPFAVEYALTPKGQRLRSLLDAYREVDEMIVIR